LLGQTILIESGLSYLGLGAQPPLPSWGNMVVEGRQFLASAWWIATFPGLAIFVTVLGFNLFGDGLRDASDPTIVYPRLGWRGPGSPPRSRLQRALRAGHRRERRRCIRSKHANMNGGFP